MDDYLLSHEQEIDKANANYKTLQDEISDLQQKLTDAEKEQFFKETGKRYTSWLEMLNGVTVFMGVMPSRVSHTSWELVLGRDPDEGMNVTPE